MSKLHEDFISRYAVDIANIRMEAFKIMDTELAQQISQHVDAARAEAESLKSATMTKAQADIILTKAKAEAEAIRLKAVAESERATLLSSTDMGQKESPLSIYADMVKESNPDPPFPLEALMVSIGSCTPYQPEN